MRLGLVAAAVLWACAMPRPGLALDCGKAALPTERTICGRADLRGLDAELNRLYGIVRHAVGPSLRAPLLEGQRRWLAGRDRDCTAAACLTPLMQQRVAALGALAARVSDANPTLPDLDPVWLEGDWRTGGAAPAGMLPVSDLPSADTSLTFRSGALCVAKMCASFGLEPQKLADGPGREELPKTLGVSSDTSFLLAYIGGKAAYGLVPMPDGTLLAITPGCAPTGSPCGTVRQIWRAGGPTAALIRRSIAPPRR